jgi:ER membrane protein SH3
LELASSNLICSVALTGVLALQAGRLWAQRADDDDNAVVEAEEPKGIKSQGKTPDIHEDIVKPLLQQRLQPS